MEILIIFLLGMVADRWIIPFLDMILELINYTVSKFASGISLQTQRDQLKFQKEVEETGLMDESNRIGFEYATQDEYCDDEEDWLI